MHGNGDILEVRAYEGAEGEEQRARTVRSSKMCNCAWLSINVMEPLGMIRKAYVMAVIKRGGPKREGESGMMNW